MPKKENDEKIVDIKGTIENFIEEEKPELSQEEAIKEYREEKQEYVKKKKSNSDAEDENEDDEHLKRLKKDLLESLERVNLLAKKIFGEKEKDILKDIKVKTKNQKSKNREKDIEQAKSSIEDKTKQENMQEKGRSRE